MGSWAIHMHHSLRDNSLACCGAGDGQSFPATCAAQKSPQVLYKNGGKEDILHLLRETIQPNRQS